MSKTNSTDDLISRLNSGEGVEVKTGNGYEDLDVQITDIKVVKGGKKCPIDHPLLKSEWTEGKAMLVVYMRVRPKSGGDWTEHMEVGGLMDQENKNFSIYPPYTNKKGEYKAGTLLWEIIHHAKKVEGQEERFAPGWKFTPELFKGLVLGEMQGKWITSKDGKEYFILLTSRQKIKDEEYAKSRENGGADADDDDDDDFGSDDDDDGELPF